MLDPGDGTTYLLKPGLDFKLEPYDDGAPAPVAPDLAAPFLLATGSLDSEEVLFAKAKALAAPASAYFQDRFMIKRSGQVGRFKAARLFNPLHANANAITEADVEALSCFNALKHPHVKKHYEAMHTEIQKYNAKVAGIKPLAQRIKKDATGKEKDTFDIQAWWRSMKLELPHHYQVLCVVLLHSPNSCPPERLFSILNNTFDADQMNALMDYMELALQLQFNNRTRK